MNEAEKFPVIFTFCVTKLFFWAAIRMPPLLKAESTNALLLMCYKRGRIIETWCLLGWKRPLRLLSPTINPALPSPLLNHIPKCHICMAFKYLQDLSDKHLTLHRSDPYIVALNSYVFNTFDCNTFLNLEFESFSTTPLL